MPAVDRPHKWKWPGWDGAGLTKCIRCGREYIADGSFPTNCMTKGEYQERLAWEEQAAIAAGLMQGPRAKS